MLKPTEDVDDNDAEEDGGEAEDITDETAAERVTASRGE